MLVTNLNRQSQNFAGIKEIKGVQKQVAGYIKHNAPDISAQASLYGRGVIIDGEDWFEFMKTTYGIEPPKGLLDAQNKEEVIAYMEQNPDIVGKFQNALSAAVRDTREFMSNVFDFADKKAASGAKIDNIDLTLI